jgi:hypothetical protein
MMLELLLSLLITFTSCKTGQNTVKNDQNKTDFEQIKAENESDIYIENQQFLNQ